MDDIHEPDIRVLYEDMYDQFLAERKRSELMEGLLRRLCNRIDTGRPLNACDTAYWCTEIRAVLTSSPESGK